jgi:hypothetical protein
MAIQLSTANFPLGLVPPKKAPTSPKIFHKMQGKHYTVFRGLVGAFFGEPTQVEI